MPRTRWTSSRGCWSKAPDDDEAQWVRADALELAHSRADSGEVPVPQECPCWSGRPWAQCCAPAERAALERFGDRQALYALRRGMQRFTATDPCAAAAVRDAVQRWMDDAGFDDGERDALAAFAAEHAWIVGGDGRRRRTGRS